MILYHYEKGDRPITEGGFWFKYGGIPQEDTPDGLAPMWYVEGWDKDYVCCCDTIQDVLSYFPKEVCDRIGGKFMIYEYEGKIIKQKDVIMEYLTADSREMRLIGAMDYESAAFLAQRLCRRI